MDITGLQGELEPPLVFMVEVLMRFGIPLANIMDMPVPKIIYLAELAAERITVKQLYDEYDPITSVLSI